MASTHAKAVRRADVLKRLSDRLGIEQADLYINARGDKEAALIITLERIADAVDQRFPAGRRDDAEDKPATKAEAISDVKVDLEAETGHEVAKTGDTPPTLVETDKPATGSEVVDTPPNSTGLTTTSPAASQQAQQAAEIDAKPKGKAVKGDKDA